MRRLVHICLYQKTHECGTPCCVGWISIIKMRKRPHGMKPYGRMSYGVLLESGEFLGKGQFYAACTQTEGLGSVIPGSLA